MHGSSLAGRAAGRVAVTRLTATLLSASLLVATLSGCTMCPSPYDYSGPVPNGSAPQNDFRARSNGILPLGGQPRPWPPVVHATPAAAESPTLALPLGETPTVPSDATWLVAAEETSDASHDDAVLDKTAGETVTADTVLVDPAPVDTTLVEERVPELLPAHDPPPRPESPARVLRETDGWRPKQ